MKSGQRIWKSVSLKNTQKAREKMLSILSKWKIESTMTDPFTLTRMATAKNPKMTAVSKDV